MPSEEELRAALGRVAEQIPTQPQLARVLVARRVRRQRLLRAVPGASVAAGVVAVLAVALAHGPARQRTLTTNHPVLPGGTPGSVYRSFLTDSHKPVAGSSGRGTVLSTPPLPAGEYLTTVNVALVLGPNDNVRCQAVPAGQTSSDRVFGVAGSAAQTNASPDGGTHGNAVWTATSNLTVSGDRIDVICRSTLQNPTKSTYISGATITALPVSGVVAGN